MENCLRGGGSPVFALWDHDWALGSFVAWCRSSVAPLRCRFARDDIDRRLFRRSVSLADLKDRGESFIAFAGAPYYGEAAESVFPAGVAAWFEYLRFTWLAARSDVVVSCVQQQDDTEQDTELAIFRNNDGSPRARCLLAADTSEIRAVTGNYITFFAQTSTSSRP